MIYGTKHTGRKTPHAMADNVYGGKSVDKVWAFCFKQGDPDAELIKKYIPKSNCYTKPGTQNLPDDKFKSTDIRKWHTSVWNQKSANYAKFGMFKTNYEIREFFERASLSEHLL